LIGYALFTLVLILFAEGLRSVLEHYFPADEQVSPWLRRSYVAAHVLEHLKPSLYGLLGALSYLIRSAHEYFNNRSFDLQRRPEYYNRMLLGAIAGSIALLFVDPKTGGSTNVGPNALAFLVGYNTDNLFNLIERLGATVLPKVPVPSTTAGGLATLTKLSLPPEAYGGQSVSGTVILSDVAPAAGVEVSFTSAGGVTAPPKVTVSAGQKETTFTFKPDKPITKQVGTITASGNGASATVPFTVHPPLTVAKLIVVTDPVQENAPLQAKQDNPMRVTLSDHVPFDSVSITLATDIARATLPSTVRIDKGSDSATFILKTDEATTGTITVTLFDTPKQFKFDKNG